MPRYELPPGLTPEEERAVLLALEKYLAAQDPSPHPWVLAGRIDATGQGALQARKLSRDAWRRSARLTFARRGAPSLAGRGDAK